MPHHTFGGQKPTFRESVLSSHLVWRQSLSLLFLPLNFTFIQSSCLTASSLLLASLLIMQMHTGAPILLCEFQRCDGKHIKLIAIKDALWQAL